MTFSIAARCPRDGLFGIAVTTSSIAVGSRCCFVRSGIGAVLTQHRTDPRLGPLALDFIERGLSAADALAAVMRTTAHRDWRQLAAVDRNGGTAFYHGAHVRPIVAAAEGGGAVAIGNILASERVCAAEIAAFAAAAGRAFAERLLDALDAGLAAGGEINPLRSAALLVSGQYSFPLIDLRTDDDPAPLTALRRLWGAYEPQLEEFVRRALDPDSVEPR